MEFITATVHMNKMDKEDHLFSAFKYFDKDNSGYVIDYLIDQLFLHLIGSQLSGFVLSPVVYSYITTDELEQALKDHNMGDQETIKDIIAEVDIDNVSKTVYCDVGIV